MSNFLARIVFLFLTMAVLTNGARVAYEGWKDREPTLTTVADYINSDKSKKWVVLTDAKINLLNAVTKTTRTTTTSKKTYQVISETEELKLYIPIESTESIQNDTVILLLETDDYEILTVARQMGAQSEAKLLEFIVRERNKLIRSVVLSGVMKRGEGSEIRKHIKNLASDFYILKHNETVPSWTVGLGIMGGGLLMLILLVWEARRSGMSLMARWALIGIGLLMLTHFIQIIRDSL